ncbi:40S ribosomal protein [Coelomomyces lativittatus]|nr:40S ribosomal protein [Coelomomyces lativittatus]KAJ1512257.1 40S ribosomal protein [Coelomomyces lativittatus]KAJ1513850.1 40S ribosomal protein [Coelomomyces lativittatus]
MSLQHKILKPQGVKPNSVELNIAQNLLDLENSVSEIRADLRVLQIVGAKEVELGKGKKAIVIFVPFPQLKQFHKIHQRLVREIEKKNADRHVLFVAHRRILPQPTRSSRQKQKRPISRTLTSVHDEILRDLVYPTEIVGKRTKIRVDGSRKMTVFLDKKDSTFLEHKLDTFACVYKKLTGKDVQFGFPYTS